MTRLRCMRWPPVSSPPTLPSPCSPSLPGNMSHVTFLLSHIFLTSIIRTPADFGRVTCTGANLLGEGAPCVFQITRRLQLPGVHDCSLTNKENSLAVICEERGTSFSPIVQGSTQFLADLQDLKLGLSTQLSSSRPTFQFSSVRPGATFNISIYRYL